ncbi:MAG: calcium/sodium antiporter [Desulforegulaceae bacterium]|nr:calcium/sodium antiporter [Desulforegulaceae bacterium]
MSYLFLVAGFILLVKSADFLVNGASAIAKKFNISDMVIGLTVVAFGSSLPELFVNVVASTEGNTGVATGNILGSNIANILMIIGICGVIKPLKVPKGTVKADIPMGLLAVIVLAASVNDQLLDHYNYSLLSRSDGLVFLGFFLIFFHYSFSLSKRDTLEDIPENLKEMHWALSAGLIIIGIIGLAGGAELIVRGAVDIAQSFGVSDEIIGLTIIAIGTSLPELAASVVAAYKGQSEMAVGNVAGSNIFNIFFVLGISATIKPLPFSSSNNLDILMVVLANILLLLFMATGRKRFVDRWEGGLMLVIYFGYLAFRVLIKI